MKSNKALFLDLDGTIIETASGKKFPKNKYDWKFKQGILKKIKQYYESGYKIIIVSNQAGIEYGYVSKEDFEDKLKVIIQDIKNHTGASNVYGDYCPESRSFYRKPNPGMGYAAAIEHELNLAHCIMVGDASGLDDSFSDSDKKFARNCNMMYFDINSFLDNKEVSKFSRIKIA